MEAPLQWNEERKYFTFPSGRIPAPNITDFTQTDLNQMLKQIDEEYYCSFKSERCHAFNPLKTTAIHDLDSFGSPRKVTSMMWAKLPVSLCSGSKTVYYEETPTGMKRSSITCVFNANGDLLGAVESSQLTALRCGLLAVSAAERVMRLNKDTTVGLIGAGKINFGVANVLHKLRGVRRFIITSRNVKRTQDFMFDLAKACDPSHIFKAGPTLDQFKQGMNVVSSATTNSDPKQMLSYRELRGPSLFLTFDTGFMLDETFRDGKRMLHFSDYPAQLDAVREIEFPYDQKWTTPKPLCELGLADRAACVSFYGIAMADIVCARYFLMKGLKG
jgi:hypothetical protein